MIVDDIRAAAERSRQATIEKDAADAELKRLVLLGLAQGITPTQAAEVAGLHRRTVYKWIDSENQ